jgi:catechol 2,3-dioxygenase-like lactoylglutathione lyase family enzyme
MPLPILSVVHVNANCSELGRSLAFYRDLVGLTPMTHTCPSAPQDGAGFGLPGKARWDAWLLHDARGYAAPGVDLLEWKEPLPGGRPYAEANHLGMFRLCLTAPDLGALHARLLAAGVPCLSPPVVAPIDPAAGLSVRFFCALDPDGTAVEFIELPGPTRLMHVNVNPFVVDLLEWRTPRPVGRPYASANHLGLFRLAFLVEDARACHAELVRQGVDSSPPVWLEMGPEVPIAGLFAVFFRDPDGTCLELIEVLPRDRAAAQAKRLRRTRPRGNGCARATAAGASPARASRRPRSASACGAPSPPRAPTSPTSGPPPARDSGRPLPGRGHAGHGVRAGVAEARRRGARLERLLREAVKRYPRLPRKP